MSSLSLTTAELASRWKMEPNTLRTWRARKIGPPYYKPSGNERGACRYKLDAIERWESFHPEIKKETAA
jgi:hypothetical protein